MSWSIEEHIGEGRPWPAQVVVYRGETSECLAYVSGEVADRLKAENIKLRTQLADVTESMGRVEERCAKLRKLVRDLRMAYIGALNECEGMEAGLIWEYCDVVENELVRSHARFETDRHRFDVTMQELGIEVGE